MPFCLKCGRYTQDEPGARFCPYCGSLLQTDEVSKIDIESYITKEYGILSDSDEQVLMDIDVDNSYIPILKDRERMFANVAWFRPFGLFNYMFAGAERESERSYRYILSGKLIITSKRVIVLEQQGFLTSKLVPISFTDIRSLCAVNVSKNLFGGSKLLLTYESPDKVLLTMEFNTNERYEHINDIVNKLKRFLEGLSKTHDKSNEFY